jgi:hypothetical protein
MSREPPVKRILDEGMTCFLGMGGSPVEAKAVSSGDFSRIRDLVASFTAVIRWFRGPGWLPSLLQ